MSFKRLDTLGDYMRHGVGIGVRCQCGHEATLQAFPILLRLNERARPLDSPGRMDPCRLRFRCSRCGRLARAVRRVPR